MIPLSDVNPTRRFPVMNVLLIGLNLLVFMFELGMPDARLNRFMLGWGLVPRDLLSAITHPFALSSFHAFMTLVTSQFIHAGWAHILGNMLFLWIFGDNIEDVLGGFLYLLFYVTSGIAAGLAQTFVLAPFLGNVSIPSVGASGAIAGVLGAYLVLYPGTRVRVWFPIFLFVVIKIPAIILIGLWFVQQFVSGVGSLSPREANSGGVAFWAHIGGFIAGMILILPFWGRARRMHAAQPPRPQYYAPYDDVNRW